MKTQVLAALDPDSSDEAVRQAAEALARGDLVVFPTETVYGLGASAVHPRAIEAIHAIKDRPAEKPFSLHLPDPDLAERYAGPLSPVARRLIRKLWPGPVTLVVPDRRVGHGPEGLIETSVYWNGTVGLRCPSHRVGRAILREAGVPVVASSANLAGRPPPREAAEALADLCDRVPLIIDGGRTRYAGASTVVRVGEDDSFEVLREGAVTARRIQRLARTRVLFVCTGNICRSPMAEAMARRMLADRMGCDPEFLEDRGIEVSSAGVAASEGLGPSEAAVQVMAEREIDIRRHQSSPMTVDALLSADYIYVMTRSHLAAVKRLAPEVAERVALLDKEGGDIADPIGGDAETYRACSNRI
jgi:protein-tyrosine phosphatase